MLIREIRNQTGLTQKQFSEYYRIPLQTLKQWESAPGSSSHRAPSDYLVYMLNRLIQYDFNVNINVISRTEALIMHAQESRYNAKQWLRYLRKEFDKGRIPLTKRDLDFLLKNDSLTLYQKLSLKRAMTAGTATNRYMSELNSPAGTPMLNEIIRRQATHEQ